jgi:monoamine oxidase
MASGNASADHDVVVIGAGAAGIAAAMDLTAAGLRVAIVEARDRPGGRAHTRRVAGQPYDAGAAYVHYGQSNPWIALARHLGVELPRHRGWGGGVLFRQGRRLGAAEVRALKEARGELWEKLEQPLPEAEDRSLAQLVEGANPELRIAAQRFGQQAIGEDPERIGLFDLSTQWNGDDRVVPIGYGTLVAMAAASLPIRYGVAATLVDWSGPGIRVETSAGTLAASEAIVTVPLGVLRAGGIAFRPALPGPTAGAIEALTMGALTKVAIALDGERFGLASPSDMADAEGPFVFELFPFDRNLVIATIGGTPARDLAALGEAGAVAEAVDRLAAMVGGELRRHVVAGQLSSWWLDPYSWGSYSVAGPGQHAARHRLSQPVAERLTFAGEATSGGGDTVGGAMTVGGATLAGRKAAAGIIARRNPA